MTDRLNAALQEEKDSLDVVARNILSDANVSAQAQLETIEQDLQERQADVETKVAEIYADFNRYVDEKCTDVQTQLQSISSNIPDTDEQISSLISQKESEFRQYTNIAIDTFRTTILGGIVYGPPPLSNKHKLFRDAPPFFNLPTYKEKNPSAAG